MALAADILLDGAWRWMRALLYPALVSSRFDIAFGDAFGLALDEPAALCLPCDSSVLRSVTRGERMSVFCTPHSRTMDRCAK